MRHFFYFLAYPSYGRRTVRIVSSITLIACILRLALFNSVSKTLASSMRSEPHTFEDNY